MSDRYLEVSQTPWGNALISMLGLPKPPRLARGDGPWAERPLEGQGVVLGVCEGGQLARVLVDTLHRAGAAIRIRPELPGLSAIKSSASAAGVTLAGNLVVGETADPNRAVVYDATGLGRPEQLRELYAFFQPLAATIPPNGRVVILGRPADAAGSAPAAA